MSIRLLLLSLFIITLSCNSNKETEFNRFYQGTIYSTLDSGATVDTIPLSMQLTRTGASFRGNSSQGTESFNIQGEKDSTDTITLYEYQVGETESYRQFYRVQFKGSKIVGTCHQGYWDSVGSKVELKISERNKHDILKQSIGTYTLSYLCGSVDTLSDFSLFVVDKKWCGNLTTLRNELREGVDAKISMADSAALSSCKLRITRKLAVDFLEGEKNVFHAPYQRNNSFFQHNPKIKTPAFGVDFTDTTTFFQNQLVIAYLGAFDLSKVVQLQSIKLPSSGEFLITYQPENDRFVAEYVQPDNRVTTLHFTRN